MTTLHAYVLRELLKTFGLALTALTALFIMAGGVYNVLRSEGATASDLLEFLPMVIPIGVTLVMPLAALFAATIVYGRLAADNELLACRAAGVNIHRLFLAAILLSVFVASFTLLFGNYVIPGFAQRLMHAVRTNLRDIAAQRLRMEGYVRFEPKKSENDQFLLTAEHVQTDFSRQHLIEKDLDPELDYLMIMAPTFLQLDDNGAVARYIAAEAGLCQFDTRSEPIEIAVFLSGARHFEVGKGAMNIDNQWFGPMYFSLPFRLKPGMADLSTLLLWRQEPWRGPKIHQSITQDLLPKVCGERFAEYCGYVVGQKLPLLLIDEVGGKYQISANTCEVVDGRPRLGDVRVLYEQPEQNRALRYEAGEARLTVRPAVEDGTLGAQIEIRLLPTPDQPVLERAGQGGEFGAPREKDDVSLDGALLPQEVAEDVQVYTPAALLDPAAELPLGEKLQSNRTELQEKAGRLQRKVAALVHFRLGFSLSALVTIVMGAALGVAFRGSRALAAFGLSCVPLGTVLILMLMGRQLGENVGTETVGAAIIWGGLVLVGFANLVLLRLGVRR